jgi:hypothetical protein
MHFFTSLGNGTCRSPEVVLMFLLYEDCTIHNVSDKFDSCIYLFLCRLRFSSIPTDKNLIASDLYAPTSNSCIFTPIKNWTHVYMNLFTGNSPYYHLLKYLLFLLYITYWQICQKGSLKVTNCRSRMVNAWPASKLKRPYCQGWPARRDSGGAI